MSKRITVLFDANPLVNGNKSGVGYYTQGLIKALADTYPEDIQLIGHYFSFLGRKDNLPLPTAANIKYVRSRLIPGKILSITRVLGFQPPLELFFKRSGDVALFASFVSLPSLIKIPKLVVIHDLCFLEKPEYVPVKNRLFLQRFVPRSVRSAAAVITVSDATKQAVQKHYKTAQDKLIVTPIPPSAKDKSDGFNLSDIGIKDKFILFVGTLEPRKNVINLVKAYEQLPDNIRQKYQLVLAGGVGWYIQETRAYIARLQEQGIGIVTPGYVSQECRAALYEHASLFVLPSHYEGFGMPILEAMNYGVPTAVSNLPVFHEVAGDASAYFDKDDPADIAKILSSLLSDQQRSKDLAAKGEAQLKAYSWPAVAKSVYEKIREITES